MHPTGRVPRSADWTQWKPSKRKIITKNKKHRTNAKTNATVPTYNDGDIDDNSDDITSSSNGASNTREMDPTYHGPMNLGATTVNITMQLLQRLREKIWISTNGIMFAKPALRLVSTDHEGRNVCVPHSTRCHRQDRKSSNITVMYLFYLTNCI